MSWWEEIRQRLSRKSNIGSNKMNIMYLIPRITTQGAGTEKQLIALLNGIGKSKNNITLTLFQETDFEIEKVINGIRIIKLDIRKIFSIRSIYKLYAILNELKIEILHTFFIDGNILGILAALFYKETKILTSRRDIGYWYTGLYRLLFRFLNRFTDLVVANSDVVKLITIAAEKCSPNKIAVIPNIIDFNAIESFKNLPPSIDYLDFIAQFDHIVGIVANLRPVKRIDVFLQAAASVVKKHPDTCFVIIGAGYQLDELSNLANHLKLQDQVYFLGRQQPVIPYVKTFDVAVNSSDSEGLSNAVIEYMACGVPTIATAVGGNLELVDDGSSGYLFSPGDALQLAERLNILIEDKQKRIDLGKRGREFVVAKFDSDKIIHNYIGLYQKLRALN